MPAKKGTRRRVTTRIVEDGSPESDQLKAILRDYGGTTLRAKLWRMTSTLPKRPEYLDTIQVNVDLIEEVKAGYGGGDYNAKIINEDGYIQGGSLHFTIAGPPVSTTVTATVANASSDMDLLRTKLLERALEPPKSLDVEKILTLGAGLVAMVTPIITAVMTRPTGGGGDVAETLNLVRNAERDGEQRGRRLGALEAGSGGESVADVAKTYLPLVVGMLQDKHARDTAHARPAALPDSPPPPVSTAMALPLPPEYAWLANLRPYYAALLGQAKSDNDPDALAGFALSQLPDDVTELIDQCTRRDDFRQTLTNEMPLLASQYGEWLNDFIDGIIRRAGPAPKAALSNPRGKKR